MCACMRGRTRDLDVEWQRALPPRGRVLLLAVPTTAAAAAAAACGCAVNRWLID